MALDDVAKREIAYEKQRGPGTEPWAPTCRGQDGEESWGCEAEFPRGGTETCSVVLGSQVETYFQVERMTSCEVLLVSELRT